MGFKGIVLAVIILAMTHKAAFALEDNDESWATKAPNVASVDTSSSVDAYVVGNGNMLQIKIYGEAGIQTIFRVDELGYITHPYLGRVKLSGLSVSQAERYLENQLSGDYIVNPNVTVFVMEHSHFSVMGEVKKPGNYEITGRVSLIEALTIAGGFTPIANPRNVKIIRKTDESETTLRVDTAKITESGDMPNDFYMEADDIVIVPKSFF